MLVRACAPTDRVPTIPFPRKDRYKPSRTQPTRLPSSRREGSIRDQIFLVETGNQRPAQIELVDNASCVPEGNRSNFPAIRSTTLSVKPFAWILRKSQVQTEAPGSNESSPSSESAVKN
jgi:hypothetical protein